MEVVKGENTLGRDFASAEAVTEEGLGKTGDVRVGVGAERGGVELEFLVFDVDGAIGSKGLSVAGAAGGVDAVEHVDALANHFEKFGSRHACATHLLEAGVNIRLIQKWLGHNQLSTTMMYTHLTRAAETVAGEAINRLMAPLGTIGYAEVPSDIPTEPLW